MHLRDGPKSMSSMSATSRWLVILLIHGQTVWPRWVCGKERDYYVGWRVVCMWQGGDSVCVGSRLGDVCTVMMTRVSDDNLVTMIML